MDSSPLIQFLFIFILTLINAFFSASEMAIISVNKSKITVLSNEGNNKAKLLLKLLDEPSRLLATIQVGITFASFLASASAATGLSKRLTDLLKLINIPANDSISLVIITILLSYLTLVLGELFPKRVALQYSEELALIVSKPILLVSKVMLPFVKLLTVSTNLLLRIFGIDAKKLDEKVSEEEIKMMINVCEENGVINETEKDMLNGIFQFDDTLAKRIMTPRTNVFALDINTPINDAVKQIIEEQYSRVPIFDDEIDNIIGILYIKDLLCHIVNGELREDLLKTLLRPAYFVPETKNIDTLFKELQNTKNYMAILIDEYGGFSGIVTIEDLIEEIVGNIRDEYDDNDEQIKQIDVKTYLVDGLMPIEELNEHLNLKLPSDDMETIGGFIIDSLGCIPKENEKTVVQYENIHFTIDQVEEKRIKKLKISIM